MDKIKLANKIYEYLTIHYPDLRYKLSTTDIAVYILEKKKHEKYCRQCKEKQGRKK